MVTIPQEYVGLVNVVGDCYCFGLVQHLKLMIRAKRDEEKRVGRVNSAA